MTKSRGDQALVAAARVPAICAKSHRGHATCTRRGDCGALLSSPRTAARRYSTCRGGPATRTALPPARWPSRAGRQHFLARRSFACSRPPRAQGFLSLRALNSPPARDAVAQHLPIFPLAQGLACQRVRDEANVFTRASYIAATMLDGTRYAQPRSRASRADAYVFTARTMAPDDALHAPHAAVRRSTSGVFTR